MRQNFHCYSMTKSDCVDINLSSEFCLLHTCWTTYWQLFINRLQMSMQLLVVECGVYQFVIWSWGLVVSKSCLIETPGVSTMCTYAQSIQQIYQYLTGNSYIRSVTSDEPTSIITDTYVKDFIICQCGVCLLRMTSSHLLDSLPK